jgi:hypothetical protein
MQTYVAEIEGRAIMAFRARNEEQAQVWVANEESIRSDLLALESQGRRLWDGKTELVVRAATIPEQAAWRKKSVELTEQDADHHPDGALVFLVPVELVLLRSQSA